MDTNTTPKYSIGLWEKEALNLEQSHISSVYTHKYIFPHGRYWKYDAVPSHNKHLKTIQRWYLNGFNYYKTLATWLKNFDDNQAIIKDLNYGIEYAKFPASGDSI